MVQDGVGVAAEDDCRVLVVLGSAHVDLAAAVLLVADFETGAAHVLFTDNDCVASGVTPVVVVECACGIGEVAEHEADVMGHVPAELDTVKVEFGVFTAIVDGCRVGKVVTAGFRSLDETVGTVDVGAVGVRHYGNGHVFVEFRLGRKFDILVGGVCRAEILVEIAAVVKVYISVQLDIEGECKRCGR